MQRIPVQSTNIESLDHDPNTNTLEIGFKNGRVYQYHEVNIDEFNAMLSAPSIGSHFAAVVKPFKAATIVNTDPVTGADANG